MMNPRSVAPLLLVTLTGCAHFGGVAPTMRAEAPQDIAEFWGKVIAQTDPDPDDGTVTYIFAYADPKTGKEMKFSATSSCKRGVPMADDSKIHVKQVRFADITNFSVTCD